MTTSRETINRLNSMLEFGMWDNNLLESILFDLENESNSLLPTEIPTLSISAFYLTKVGREPFAKRILVNVLNWLQANSGDKKEIDICVQNIQYIFKGEGIILSEDEVLCLKKSDFQHNESWKIYFPEKLPDTMSGIYKAVSSQIPLTKFRGVIRQLNTSVLNPIGKLVIKKAFPKFNQFTSISEFIEHQEYLLSIGVTLTPQEIKELQILKEQPDIKNLSKYTVHRRFAGGDGLLPRSCYFSICDNLGVDEDTMNREMFAYVDRKIPGTVYVTDSTNSVINEYAQKWLRIKPGYTFTYIMIFAPERPNERVIFESYYRELIDLKQPTDTNFLFFALENKTIELDVENVFDLRIPEVQQWFFEHFKAGDSILLNKANGRNIENFFQMLPTLMHPKIGGTEVTHGIGTWLRTSYAKGLIYPSARANVSTEIIDGKLVYSHGWNFLDYRPANKLPAQEIVVDTVDWIEKCPFELQVASFNSDYKGSWKIKGIEDDYVKLKNLIEG